MRRQPQADFNGRAQPLGWGRSARCSPAGGCGCGLLLNLLSLALLSLAAPPSPAAAACPNAQHRVGPSAALPDCRAYELVTPPVMDNSLLVTLTSGFAPTEPIATAGPNAGDSVIFDIAGGTLGGFNGNGTPDQYRAVRSAGGWQISLTGPSGEQTEVPLPGGVSPDHDYSFWESRGSRSLGFARWLRLPGGAFELIGKGSAGQDPFGFGRWITPGANHVIFETQHIIESPFQLEPNAPLSGTTAIYDRRPGGPTHVVSLLPPPDETPDAGEDAQYQGSAGDGSVVAFKVGVEPSLYVRVDNAATQTVTAGPNTFGGISENGDEVYYEQEGDLFAYEIGSQQTQQITTGSGAQFVNVSADGSHVYFVSTQQLDGPSGTLGANNFYVWDGSSIGFIATLDPSDLEGEVNLTRWAPDVATGAAPARDPSRSTPDGSVLVFESHANLTPYDAEGHSEIYRYDAAGQILACVSCNPAGEPAVSDAHLQRVVPTLEPIDPRVLIHNVTNDGSRVFFETRDPLMRRDVDGATDVYEWHSGELSLISSGQSLPDGTLIFGDFVGGNFLYGVSPDGTNVLFLTNDALLPQVSGQVPLNLYDARVNGGFPQPQSSATCAEETCQGQPAAAPGLPGIASDSFRGEGNARHARHRRCERRAAGKARRHGRKKEKARCARHFRRKHHARSGRLR
jgi:hypothetical protein